MVSITTVCVESPFPSFSSIHASLSGLFAFPDGSDFHFPKLSLPNMPSLSFQPFENMLSYNINLVKLAGEMMRTQLLNLVGYVYDVLSSIVSLPLPSLPVIGDLTDLLANKARAIMDALKEIYNSTGTWGGLSIPDPLFPGFSIPDFELNDAFQLSVAKYLDMMNNTLFSMVNMIAGIFELPGMPELPKMPTWEEIYAMLPSFPTLSDLKELSFPGFNFSLSLPDPLFPSFSMPLPDPLFPSFSMPAIEFMDGLKTILTSLAMESLQKITDFITGVLGISLTFPILCIPVTTE